MTETRIFDLANGEILLIDKPYRWTSFDVVKKVKWLISNASGNTQNQLPVADTADTAEKQKPAKRIKIKVGHAGTLDPLATGLLIVCTGKFTKKIQEIQGAEKEYTGIIRLGATTPSFDLETPVDKTFALDKITAENIHHAAIQLTGTYMQIPPVFSAKKIDGKRAYEHARKGNTIEMKSAEITVKEFEITAIALPDIHFRVICSKGTYLRALARDFGELLQNGAHLSQLCRTRIGNYQLDDALGIEEFIKISQIKKELSQTIAKINTEII